VEFSDGKKPYGAFHRYINLYLVCLFGSGLTYFVASLRFCFLMLQGSYPLVEYSWFLSGHPLIQISQVHTYTIMCRHSVGMYRMYTWPAVLNNTYSAQGNVSLGSLDLTIDRHHHGAELSCRATNPALPDHSLQDTLVLHVYCKF
jgi:hypothetical protein